MKTKPRAKITEAAEPVVFLKADAIAKRLGLCAQTIHRWAAAGYITRRKLSRKTVLFNVSEVLAYVDSCKVMAGAA